MPISKWLTYPDKAAKAQPKLRFPNASRSYEASRGAVRFWGHDQSMEVSFYLTTEALKDLEPRLEADEVGFLRAFDANTSRIHDAAVRAYAADRKGSYELKPADM